MAPFPVETKGNGARLRPLAVNDATVADALRERLLQLIASDRQVCLEGSEVERITTGCVQVLLAAAASLAAAGRPLGLVEPSPALQAAFADLGLAAELNRWAQAT